MRLLPVLIMRATSTVYSSRYPNAYTRSCDPSSTSAISSPLRSLAGNAERSIPVTDSSQSGSPLRPRFAISLAAVLVVNVVISNSLIVIITSTSPLSSSSRSPADTIRLGAVPLTDSVQICSPLNPHFAMTVAVSVPVTSLYELVSTNTSGSFVTSVVPSPYSKA